MVAQVADDCSVSGNLGFPLCKETWGFQNLGFPVGMKLGVSNRLSCRWRHEFGKRLGDHIFCGCCRG
jgi:hypothetical protein